MWKKNILHHDVRAGNHGARFLTFELRLVDEQTRSCLGALAHSAEFYLRHGGNRRQSLAAEAHGMKREQGLLPTHLAGGMTLERHPRVGGRHAAAVVDDLN